MSIGWFDDLNQAREYFEQERLETDAWDALYDTNGIKETKILKNAYNRLYYDVRWNLPTYAEATTDELVKLRYANAEMAYYLAVHLADEDRRKGLQAQGVTQAGIVKESYSEDMLKEIPVPAVVIAVLEEFSAEGSSLIVKQLDRDEDDEDMTL
jgi:hypothetical protein